MLDATRTVQAAQALSHEALNPLAAMSFAAMPFIAGLELAFGGLSPESQNKAFAEATFTMSRAAFVASAGPFLESAGATFFRSPGIGF